MEVYLERNHWLSLCKAGPRDSLPQLVWMAHREAWRIWLTILGLLFTYDEYDEMQATRPDLFHQRLAEDARETFMGLPYVVYEDGWSDRDHHARSFERIARQRMVQLVSRENLRVYGGGRHQGKSAAAAALQELYRLYPEIFLHDPSQPPPRVYLDTEGHCRAQAALNRAAEPKPPRPPSKLHPLVQLDEQLQQLDQENPERK